jgi:hypothetical protein
LADAALPPGGVYLALPSTDDLYRLTKIDAAIAHEFVLGRGAIIINTVDYHPKG